MHKPNAWAACSVTYARFPRSTPPISNTSPSTWLPLAHEAAESIDLPAGVTCTLSFPRAPRPLAPALGDADLLFLAVYNLLSNAVRYSNAQGHIEVRGHELDGWVVLEVSDTGIGIAPEEVHQVWEELARGTNGRHVPGSGLGLPYVAAIAKRHHGHATLESKPGEGTRVRLHLPAAH
jgi:two-component system, OmpR family, sensor kinase